MDIVPSRHLLSTASRFSKISLSFAGPLGLLASLVPRYIISCPELAELLAFPLPSSKALSTAISEVRCPRDSRNSIPRHSDYVKRNHRDASNDREHITISADKNKLPTRRPDNFTWLTIENHFAFTNTAIHSMFCKMYKKLDLRFFMEMFWQ